MPTFHCDDAQEYARGVSIAASALSEGQLVVLPTDTLYGIGADAFNSDAVASLLAAKHRGPEMPVPVLIGSWQTVDGLVGEKTPTMMKLIEAYWPGGLSLVVNQAPSLPWNLGHTQGTVMLRMPAHPLAIELLEKTGPLAVSSANISGHAPATTSLEAVEQFGDTVSVYLDGGQAPLGQPSTIVDLTGHTPHIVREGAVSTADIARTLGVEEDSLSGATAARGESS